VRVRSAKHALGAARWAFSQSLNSEPSGLNKICPVKKSAIYVLSSLMDTSKIKHSIA